MPHQKTFRMMRKRLLLNYLKKGGKVFIILGDSEDETPNLDEVLKEYGMQEADGYIADMQRSYQGKLLLYLS